MNLPKVGLREILFMILTKRGLGSSTFSIISAGRVTSRSSPRGKGAQFGVEGKEALQNHATLRKFN